MSENVEPIVPAAETAVEVVETQAPVSVNKDGVIKLDLRKKANKQADAVQEQEADAVDVHQRTEASEEVVTEIPQGEESVQNADSVLEEVTEEVVADKVEVLTTDIQEAIVEQNQTGVELPENIQKVIDFMNETNGSLEDYVRLNTDYSSLNEDQLLREYYQNTKPHLDRDEIDFLLEDTFAYDEDVDDDRDIRKKQIARKEELRNAKKHLEGLKNRYYEEIKAGSKLSPEQQKAVEFFNRHKQEGEAANKTADKQVQTFLNKTNQLFSEDFKGFDYQVGEKKYRFKVNNVPDVKKSQSDINNFVKKFLNADNEMSDAQGYHKGLFTAMNADSVAQHFYEQGKADAMKDSMTKAKNVQMGARGVHEDIKSQNGWTVRAVDGDSGSSKLRIKTFKNIK
jgi:hypothetical protein